MFTRLRDRNLWRLYAGTLLIGIAFGISVSLTPLHLKASGLSKVQIGWVATFFALGLVVCSLPVGAIVRRFSARATLVASVLGYALCVTAFPHRSTVLGTGLIRFLDGSFSVGLFVCCETIILSRSPREHKAFATSVYAMALSSGLVIGPLVAKPLLGHSSMSFAFLCSGVLALVAALYLAFALDPDTAELHEDDAIAVAAGSSPASEPEGSILWRIKTSCAATFTFGYFQSSVVVLLPIYMMEVKNVPESDTILMSAFFAGGMLLFSNLVGRIADRVGHLRVIRVLGTIGLVTISSFVFLDSFIAMCISFLIGGATLASISPVSLALQGVVTRPSEYSRANAYYNASYALGMLIGPPIASAVYQQVSGKAMILQFVAIYIAFVIFTVVFANDDPAARRRSRARDRDPAVARHDD